jgi:endonuclease I
LHCKKLSVTQIPIFMKHRFYLLVSIMVLSFSAGIAQGTETFEAIPTATPASYLTRNWTGNGAINWSATDARTDQTINTKAIGLRNSTLSASGIAGGIGNLTFQYKYLFTGSNGSLTVSINGTPVGTISVPTTQTTATTGTINNINVSGVFSISIQQTVSGQRVAVDDVSWTSFGASCTPPSTQTSNASISGIGANTFTVNWTAGSGTNSLVVIKAGSGVSGIPTSGASYTANTAFGSGSTIAANEYVVYNGTGNSVAVTGLAAGTTYHIAVFTFNTTDNCYNTVSPVVTNAATLCAAPSTQASSLSFTPSNTSSVINWVKGDGTNSLVLLNSVNSFTDPVDGTTYAANNTYAGSGQQTIYNSTASTVTVSGLTANTTYYVRVYNFSICPATPDYILTSPAQGNFTTTNGSTGIPPGYYSSATGLSCAPLKTTLSTIINNGVTPKTYGDLWTQYLISDIKAREVGTGSANVIWDIYSDRPTGADPYNFTPGPVASGGQQDNGGAVGSEGILYNREHSFPLSWFNGNTGTPGPSTDYHHIFPTDKLVNATRSNFLYGETTSPTFTSLNGGKFGPSSFLLSNAVTVFEPINAYKGDVARAFLYMLVMYQSSMSAWDGNATDASTYALDGTTWPSVTLTYFNIMSKWHQDDPVSQKEIDRNNAGYTFQGNRNPFVDHPEYVASIWGGSCGFGTLPITIENFYGFKTNSSSRIFWNISGSGDYQSFVLERKLIHETNFTAISIEEVSVHKTAYSYEDFLANTDAFYRLKLVDNSGRISYSKTILLKNNNDHASIKVYPTIAKDQVTVAIPFNTNKAFHVTVYDMMGRPLIQTKIPAGTSLFSLPVNVLANGSYHIILNDGLVQQKQLIIISR